MRARFLGAALLLAAALAPAAASAQVVRGTLLDAETERPIELGTLLLLRRDTVPEARVVTDSAGGFALEAPRPGSFRIRAELVGYHTATSHIFVVASTDTFDVEFRLSRGSVLLAPLIVRAQPRISPTLTGYYERLERRAWGRFITREQIASRRATATTQLLARLPGVQITPRTLGGSDIVVRGTCRPKVYVDGAGGDLRGWSIDDLVHPQDIEGIEVYTSASQAPVEFQGMRGGCAVILVWTKHVSDRAARGG